jgi:RHS repeat-associated protein
VGGADYSSKEGSNAPKLLVTLNGTTPQSCAPAVTATPTPGATNTPTNTPTPGPSPTPTNTPTATPTNPPPANFNNATFVYDGDGRRVKSIFNGTTTTYFVGNHYEVTGSMITKYYYAGSQRIAMRTNGTLNYLLGDHLGSTSLTTNASGQVVSELRYKAWGEVRYASGSTPTQYTFTGQFSYVNDFGLMFYNARWLDVSLGRFAQADTITPKGVQGLDRYAYVNNSPIRYVDPSGHQADDGRNEGGGKNGCSVLTGSFNGSFTCSPAQLNRATIEQRQDWFREMLAFVNPALVEEFNNIKGILKAFIATESGAPGTWTSWGDAGILNSIQNGLALFKGETPILDSSPLSEIAANAWYDYFVSFAANRPRNETLRLWGAAEGAATTYGRWLAQEHGTTKSPGETVFLLIGDIYRDEISDRQDPATMTGPQWSADLYGWFFDTSSTVPGTDIAPVSLVAYFLLQK